MFEFGEIFNIGKQAEQAGKLARNWNGKYSMSCFSTVYTENAMESAYVQCNCAGDNR